MKSLLLICLLITAWGVEIGNPKKPKSDPNNPITADLDLSTEIVSSQMDETTHQIHMGSSSVEASLLDGASIERSCNASDVTSVAVTHKISVPFTKTRTIGQFQFKLNQDGSLTREMNWTRSEGGLACNAAQTGLKITSTNLNGAKLSAKNSRKLSRTLTLALTGRQLRKTEIDSSITANHAFSDASLASGVLTVTRTSNLSGTKTFVHTKATGEQVNLSGSVEISDNTPFVVTSTFDSTFKWKTHTIKSGTIRKIASDGSVIDLTMANLKYETASSCKPVSGTVAGALYSSKDATEAFNTFTVDFTSDNSESALIYVTFKSGERKSFAMSGCDFDEE